MRRLSTIVLAATLILTGLLLVPHPSAAEGLRPGLPASTLRDLAFAKEETRVSPQHQDLVSFRTEASAEVLGGFDRFLREAGGDWIVIGDRLTGLPALAEGKGIPWIPGTANGLTAADLGLDAEAAGGEVPVEVVAQKALEFIVSHPEMFGVSAEDLHLNEVGSGRISDYLYFVDFRWSHAGIPVEGAHIVFRLNHGNLVQFGQENVSASIAGLDPDPTLSPETAWEVLWGYLGGAIPADRIVDPGHLLVVPFATPRAAAGLPVESGKGIEYRLAYVLSFKRGGDLGTWEARVDAHTGELLSFLDTNSYGNAHGGVSPAPEKDRLFRYVDLGGGAFSDVNGLFSGTSATSALKGKYVQVKDSCGTVSLSAGDGNLNFGMSQASDCSNPGFGGNGNTRAARTQFYMLNWAKTRARTYLPSNSWLNSSAVVNTNLDGAPCNAMSDGQSTYMFRSYTSGGFYCMNTGEDQGTGYHEWGHCLDYNDGSPPPDKGSGETTGDVTGILQVHQSCFDNGAFKYMGRDYMCDGYGNPCTACSGVRDADYTKHTDPLPATADQLPGSSGFHCEKSSSYKGPCGYEGHCESYISTEAFWDLAAKDLVSWGLDQATAWQHVERLWYLSRPTATGMYACPTTATTDGCGVGSMFTVFRVVDDCDGNLANGTPHASAIYAAMNRHKIACSSVNNTDQQGCCPRIAAPVLQGTVTATSLVLNWQPSTGAAGYDVLRGESSCDASVLKLASLPSGTTTYTDTGVVRGMTYYYRVQPTASTAACPGDVSACAALTIKLAVTASATPSTGPVPLSVSFTAQAVAGSEPYTYTWDFGDGGAGSGQTASHTYTTPGTYTAKVTVKDSKNETATGSAGVTVTILPPSITSVTKAGSPFRLMVSGSNFHQNSTIKINGTAVPTTVYRSSTSLEAQGGSTLKGMVPKGQTVQVTVTNNDDGGVSQPFNYTR